MLVMYTKLVMFYQVTVEWLRACLSRPIDVTFVLLTQQNSFLFLFILLSGGIKGVNLEVKSFDCNTLFCAELSRCQKLLTLDTVLSVTNSWRIELPFVGIRNIAVLISESPVYNVTRRFHEKIKWWLTSRSSTLRKPYEKQRSLPN